MTIAVVAVVAVVAAVQDVEHCAGENHGLRQRADADLKPAAGAEFVDECAGVI